MLWIVDRDGARFVRLPPVSEIAALVERFRDEAGRPTVTMSSRVPGNVEAGKLLGALGLSGLAEGRRLLVVPDGPLHHLPFGALQEQGRYLIEDHEIVVVPSATTLALMRREPVRTAPGGFLGIGDPEAPSEDPRFSSLPDSAKALADIAAAFAPERRVVLEGARCTKQELRDQPLDSFRYVHFATHGWLDRERPGYFGLRLRASGPEAAEDFLTLDEVFSLRLGADLVVLAACNSGLGEQLRGEGLVGMARGFLYAGARSLMVTLWNVGDATTAEFMRRFYAELRSGRTVSDAMRRTQIGSIRSGHRALRQPYSWAPFVLIGDPPPKGEPPADGVSAARSRN